MKQLIVFLMISFSFPKAIVAQLGSIELMVGNRYIHYQHSIAQPLKTESKFGWQHIATLIKRHNSNPEKGGMRDELMNQAYLTYRFHKLFSLKAGLFYTNVGGYKPSVSMQFFMRRGNWVILAVPRVDVAEKGSFELFTLVEFSPTITKKVKLYTRLQAMTNVNKETHNRSYQLARIGVDIRAVQFGGGITLDEYGRYGKMHVNSGVFIRRML